MTELLQITLSLALLALSVTTARLRRDAIHPSVLVTALWGTLLSLFQALPHSMTPISLSTTLLVVVGAVFFWFGCLLTPTPSTLPLGQVRWEATLLRPVLFWVAVAGLPLYCLRALEVAESANISEIWFVNLRIALSFDEGDFLTYGPLAYLLPLAFTSTLIELAASRAVLFERRGWLAFASSVVYAVLSTGRTFLLLLLLAVGFMLLVQRRVSLGRFLFFGLFGIALVFFGIGALANKIAVDVVESVNLTPLDSLALYVFSPLSALDVALNANRALDWGLNIFRSPLAVLKVLGFDVVVVPLVKEYVDVPLPTNVYTFFLPYVHDFGIPGVLAALVALGTSHTVLYEKARGGDPRLVMACALSVYPLTMQFFQDQYLSLLTTWVQFGVLITFSFKPQRQTSALMELAVRPLRGEALDNGLLHPSD